MNIAVYQIEYSDTVVGAFDPAFQKYDCRNNPEPEKREVAHMLRFFEEGEWKKRGDHYFGLVSPKFSSKARISGRQFIDWIAAHPGYDVYFINPFPHLEYLHFNVWTQGECWHPGLSSQANTLFARAGLDIKVETLPRNTASTLLYSNYWVGNEKFWRRYTAFVRKIMQAVDTMACTEKKQLLARAPHYAAASFFSFVLERLFSTFLTLGMEMKPLPYAYTDEEMLSYCGNSLERFVLTHWAPVFRKWDTRGWDADACQEIFRCLDGIVTFCRDLDPSSLINYKQTIADQARHIYNLETDRLACDRHIKDQASRIEELAADWQARGKFIQELEQFTIEQDARIHELDAELTKFRLSWYGRCQALARKLRCSCSRKRGTV